jgi:glycosyltransferase involved in cell wall biosynthesis
MMRVGIDLTALLPESTGVDRYMIELVVHLGRVDPMTRYTLFLNREDRHIFVGRVPPNFLILPLGLRPRPLRLLFQQLVLPPLAAALRLDVVHSPSFFIPVLRGRSGHLLTVHDMTFFTSPMFHVPLRRSLAFRKAILLSIRRADLVCVPSRWVRDDILRIIPDIPPERIRAIPSGIAETFTPRPPEVGHAVARRLGIPVPYILHVGTIEPRKNLPQLLDGYRQLIATRDVAERLVLVGRLGWGYDDLIAQLAAPELRGRVHLTGYVAERDLPFLYAGARLFVYPSWQEGFGFPPLEAMACGVPTIASRASALAENLDGAAELVPPENAAALAHAMDQLLHDDNLRAARIEEGLACASRFRWEETARELVRCYSEVARRRQDRHRRASRLRHGPNA